MNHQPTIWFFYLLFASIAVLLVLRIEVPAKSAIAQQPTVVSTPTETPTPNLTTIALAKAELERQKLAEEVAKLQAENRRGWFQSNVAFALPVLITILGGLLGFYRWLADRRKELDARREAQDKELVDRHDERQKRAEDRFQSVVEGFASTSQAAKIGAAITLRTFLRPGYEQFYMQVLSLAVAHLQFESPTPHKRNAHKFPSPLCQALASVFVEAFPLARETRYPLLMRESCSRLSALGPYSEWKPFDHELASHVDETRFKSYLHHWQLDASGVHLEYTNLYGADLKTVWMREGRLIETNLIRADLTNANLTGADLTGAILHSAKLISARPHRCQAH
jgi:hypothetical protein